MKHSRALSTVLLPVAAGLVGFLLAWLAFRSVDNTGRLAQLENENRELKATVETLRSGGVGPPDEPAGARSSREGRALRAPRSNAPALPDNLEELRTLRENLAAANQSNAEWQSRATQLQTDLDQLRESQKRFAAIESGLNEQLASANRLAAARETELNQKSEQLAELQASNRQLRDDIAAAGQKAAQQVQSSAQLDEIFRRRESYLNTLVSRYREVTEQFRAFASVLENRSGPEGTPSPGISVAGPELSRIRSTIAMAEEDLRQLNALNAQAQQIQKKLSKK
jgi:chromosome segregation ATPase